MKIQQNYILRQLSADVYVVEFCSTTHDNHTDKIITMNSSSAFLWKELKGKDFDLIDASNLLQERYKIDETIATRDVSELLEMWKKAGFLIDNEQ